MKLLVVAALLLSTSAMADNQCKLDDVCVLFEPFGVKEKGFEIKCKNIVSPKIETNRYDIEVLSFRTLEPVEIKNESLVMGYSVGTLYILNQKYGELRVDTHVSRSASIYVEGDIQINAANALIDCVNSHKKANINKH